MHPVPDLRHHLRTNPEDAQTYERLKEALAEEYRNDREPYNLAKTEFVETILLRADATAEHFPALGRINA